MSPTPSFGKRLWRGNSLRRHCLLLGLLAGLVPAAGAQAVRLTNVRAEVDGGRVLVRYDLVAPPGSRVVVNATVRVSPDAPAVPLQAVTGDIGPRVGAGASHVFVWTPLTQFPDGLTASGAVFELNADVYAPRKSRAMLYTLGGGGVLAGGLAFLLLGGQSPDPGPDNGGGGGGGGGGTSAPCAPHPPPLATDLPSSRPLSLLLPCVYVLPPPSRS